MNQNKSRISALETMKALEENDVTKLKKILKKDESFSEFKLSPLSLAIKHNCSCDVIKELVKVDDFLDSGCSYETLNGVDVNPLVLACKNKNFEVQEV